MLIAAERIWLDGRLQTGFSIETDGQLVTGLRKLADAKADLHLPLVMPGCTDLQVNGGGGVLLNTAPTVDGIEAITASHHRLGTARLLPTVITDAADVMAAAAGAVIAAKTAGVRGVAGLHLEGPHIAPERRGTHDTRFIRPLDGRTLDVLRRLRAANIPTLLTLAPELATPALLREAAGLGVVISAGHSMASAAETRAALANGVTMFTHLFNAMPQMTSRAPGIIAAALLSDAWCGLITDGIHVSPEMLQIAMQSRSRQDRCFIVSDAMPTVGGPDHFTLYGKVIRVENDRLVNAAGSLAGTHIDMVTSLRRLVEMTGISPETAIAMATDLPGQAMGLPPIRVEAGTELRDLIALGEELSFIGSLNRLAT